MAHENPRRSPAPPARDPAMDAYLASLNLDGIEVDEEMLIADAKSDGVWVLSGVALVLVLVGTALWLPTTLFYQLSPIAELLSLGLWLVVALLTALLARGVYTLVVAWPFGEELAALKRHQRHLSRILPSASPFSVKKPNTAGLLGVGILAMGALLVLLLPRDVQWQGQGYTGGWFAASLAAIATGILVGRFIIAHATLERPERAPRPPIVWPSWMRWATGAAIIMGGCVILLWHSLGVQGDHSQEFTQAACSLSLGVAFAIWLARRFDELESKWQKEAQKRQEEHEGRDG